MKNLLPLFTENYRRKLILCCLLPCLIAYSQDDTSQDVVMNLKIMTYNIRHGAGMDDVIDLDRQAEVIRNAAPDIVGLQEVDSVVKRSGYIPQAAVFGEKVGMYATFGPAIPLTGGKYGVAILSREAPMSVHNIPLPGAEKRTLLVCEFQEYVFACTHLDLEEENRLASLNIILDEVARWEGKPFFICGDWNDVPSSTLISKMKRNFYFINNITDNKANYTFPARNPTRIIDYIASYGSGSNRVVKSKRSQVLNEPEASDHRPILAEISMERYTTDISSPFEDGKSVQDKDIYDLTGKRIVTDKLSPGLYIWNRKTVLVR